MVILRQKRFSDKVSKEDLEKLKKLNRNNLAGAAVYTGAVLPAYKLMDREKYGLGFGLISGAATGMGIYQYQMNKKLVELYKKYHPEDQNPKLSDVIKWARNTRKNNNLT